LQNVSEDWKRGQALVRADEGPFEALIFQESRHLGADAGPEMDESGEIESGNGHQIISK
jgi:hypothetical protein